MTISRDFADTLHAIVDILPWREENDREHHHNVIDNELPAPVEETPDSEATTE